MNGLKVWLITGAGRGMGAAFTSAALDAGHAVIATGRRPAEVADAVGSSDRLLVATLDVLRMDDANAAVAAGVERFGHIDVVVNSAGASFKGYFEEMSPAQVEQQLAVNLLGPMNVTRAVLPIMRRQRSGHLIAVSSGAGLMGFEYSSVYAASKAGLEGWMNALAQEVDPFGIRTTIVNPGFFRTGLGPMSSCWHNRRSSSSPRTSSHIVQLSLDPPLFIGKPIRQWKKFDTIAQSLRSRPPTDLRVLVQGFGSSPGTATGLARVIRGPHEFDLFQPGEILVAPATAPAWTPLLAIAAGVVTDGGGPFAHTSVVAREFGIPAIVTATGATTLIATGAMVTLHAASGTVIAS